MRPEPVQLRVDVRPASILEPVRPMSSPSPFATATATAATMADGSPAASPSRRRLQILQRLVAGLAFIATVEALIIAGLLGSRSLDPGSQVVVESAGTPAQPTAAVAPAAQPAAGAGASAADARQGRIEVTTDPAGARVSVDGRVLGTTPLTAALPAGQHTVVIGSGSETTRRTVNVTAGRTSAIVATLSPPAAPNGWLTIDTPLDLQVYKDDLLIGSTRADRLMLTPGTHSLRLASAALDFSTTVSVNITAGNTAAIRVPIPNGTISLNALPWANVWVNGQPIGATPFANLTMPIGTHEIIWRHPQLGERRQTVVLTARTPVRLVVDMRQ
jgi:hypothetical protein